jgi:hypothetical protein
MTTRTKTAWDLHLADYRKKHPDVKFSEAMKLASASYTKKNPDAKARAPRSARTQSQKAQTKIKKLQKMLAKLDAE